MVVLMLSGLLGIALAGSSTTLATTVNLVDFTAVTVTEYDEDLSSELTGVAGPKVQLEELDQVNEGALGSVSFRSEVLFLHDWCDHIGAKVSYADVTGDGKADVLCDDVAGGHWLRLETGDDVTIRFGATLLLTSGWCAGGSVMYADINGDSLQDQFCYTRTGDLQMKLSLGDGKFASEHLVLSKWCPSTTSMLSHSVVPLDLGDVDGDGKADVICTSAAGMHTWRRAMTGASFGAEQVLFSGWCTDGRLRLADVNADGTADLLCEARAADWTMKLTISGAQHQYRDDLVYAGGFCRDSGCSTAYVDLNADRAADIVCDCRSGTHAYMLSQLNTFGQQIAFARGACSKSSESVKWADLNADGRSDMICDNSASDGIDAGNHWARLSTARSISPTFFPTARGQSFISPTPVPSHAPTRETEFPTWRPSARPTTKRPSARPTAVPTRAPHSRAPSAAPTMWPSRVPSQAPTMAPSDATPTPTRTTDSPTHTPTRTPTDVPSLTPSATPTDSPARVWG